MALQDNPTVVRFERPIVTVFANYDRKMLYRLWRAFRAEERMFAGGRERFANYITDTVVAAHNKYVVLNEEGKEHSLTDSPLPESFYKFLKSKALADYTSDAVECAPKDVRFSQKTLQYIHIFLWARNYKVVSSWMCNDQSRVPDTIVRGLDDSFDIRDPFFLLPRVAEIYSVRQPGFSRGCSSYIDSIKNGKKFTYENHNWKLLGAICVLPSKRELLSKFFYFSAEQWFVLREYRQAFSELTGSSGLFGAGLLVGRGYASAFKSKDYLPGRIEKGHSIEPRISNEIYIISAKYCDGVSGKYEFFDLEMTTDKWEYDYMDSFDIMGLMMSSTGKVRLKSTKDDGSHIIVPLRLESDTAIKQICNLIA